MLIRATNLKISQKYTISLKGLDAKNHQKVEPVKGYQLDGTGKNGLDGLPGLPGQTGGSFFVEITEGGTVTGIENLTIDLRGGKGGDGQNGGDGADGKDS